MSCAGANTTRFALLKKPVPLISPIPPYTLGRDLSRVAAPDGTMPDLSDTGAEPGQVVRGVLEYGLCSATAWGDYPALVDINAEPTPEKLALLGHFLITGAYFATGTPAQVILQVLTALAAGFPVSNGIFGSDPVFNPGYAGGVLQANVFRGALDHYTYTIDYAWIGTPIQWATFLGALAAGDVVTMVGMLTLLVFYGVNSWDVAWGESDVPDVAGGLYRYDGTAAQTMADWAVWDVDEAPAAAYRSAA